MEICTDQCVERWVAGWMGGQMRDKTKVVLQKPHDLDTVALREFRKQEQEGKVQGHPG